MSNFKKNKAHNIVTNKLYNYNQKIIGIWGTNADDNADMEINKDSIFYVDHPFKQYYYEVKKDSIYIYIDGFISKSKIMMTDNNHLWLIGYRDTIRFVRIE